MQQQIFEAAQRATAATVEVCGLSSETESLCWKTSYYYFFWNFMFQHHKFANWTMRLNKAYISMERGSAILVLNVDHNIFSLKAQVIYVMEIISDISKSFFLKWVNFLMPTVKIQLKLSPLISVITTYVKTIISTNSIYLDSYLTQVKLNHWLCFNAWTNNMWAAKCIK